YRDVWRRVPSGTRRQQRHGVVVPAYVHLPRAGQQGRGRVRVQLDTGMLRKTVGQASWPVYLEARKKQEIAPGFSCYNLSYGDNSMRTSLFVLAILALTSLCFAAETVPSTGIHGNYIEARTADVYTGPCFANGEAEEVGREAVFGWQIKGGSYKGV